MSRKQKVLQQLGGRTTWSVHVLYIQNSSWKQLPMPNPVLLTDGQSNSLKIQSPKVVMSDWPCLGFEPIPWLSENYEQKIYFFF